MMFDISSMATAKGDTLNRIELSELLMNEYLYVNRTGRLSGTLSFPRRARYATKFNFVLALDWWKTGFNY